VNIRHEDVQGCEGLTNRIVSPDGSRPGTPERSPGFRDPLLTPFRRTDARFVVSYDIWGEDKFSVTMPEPAPRTVLLPASAAEAWCIENLAVNASGLPPDRPFWLLLDLRTVPRKDLSQVLGDSGINIKNFFIEFFSRQPGTDDPQWTRPAGPLRLADLVRTPGRGKIG